MAKASFYCARCETETAPLIKPLFDGFEKVGERRTCPFCGSEVQPGAGPAPGKKPPRGLGALFAEPVPKKPLSPFGDDPLQAPEAVNPFGDDAVRPKVVNPFGGETGPLRICRYCRQYVVNPFTQKCMLHERETSATDSCEQFETKKSTGRD
jgi:hypothetical protein